MPLRRLLLTLLASGALTLAACGGSSTETTGGADTTAATTTTGGATTATTEAPTTVDANAGVPADAKAFADPGGAYTISVNPAWEEGSVSAPRIWYTDQPKDGFRDNANVLIENLPRTVPLDEYLTLSLKNAPTLIKGFTVQSQEKITLANGDEGVRLQYSGSISNSPVFTFLALVTVSDSKAATVTFTAPPARFDTSVKAVEPYLRSIDVK